MKDSTAWLIRQVCRLFPTRLGRGTLLLYAALSLHLVLLFAWQTKLLQRPAFVADYLGSYLGGFTSSDDEFMPYADSYLHSQKGFPDDGVIAMHPLNATYRGFNVLHSQRVPSSLNRASCVAHCSQRRHVWFRLSMKDIRMNEMTQINEANKMAQTNQTGFMNRTIVITYDSWRCIWRRRLVISRKLKRTHKLPIRTNATFYAPNLVRCPAPYSARFNCKGHSGNLWDIELKDKVGSILQVKQVMDVQSSRDRAFQITSVYKVPDTNPIQKKLHIINPAKTAFVVSFFLFDSRLMDSCNVVDCLYQIHSATRSDPNAQGSSVESSVALPGHFVDVSLVVCPIPPQIQSLTKVNDPRDAQMGNGDEQNTKYVSLRLAYSANFLSFPTPFLPKPVFQPRDYPHVMMTICSIVRKEGYNIREWIEFHRMMGYERFVLYDNNPIDEPDTVMQKELQGYHPHLVVVIPWKIQHSQTEALTDCIVRFGSTTEWFSLIDVDEFIVPAAPYPTVRHVLTQTPLSKSSYIHSKWITFGPCVYSHHQTAASNITLHNTSLMPNTTTLSNPEIQTNTTTLNNTGILPSDPASNNTRVLSSNATETATSSATPHSHPPPTPTPTPNKKLEQLLSPNRTLAMEICHSKTKVGSELPKATFRARDAASIHGYGPHHIRLMRDIGSRKKTESVSGDKFMRVYHYRYKTWDDFLSRRLGPIAGLTTRWTESSLRGSWQRGLRNRKYFPKEKNTILRFIPELRQRLNLSESAYGFK